MHTTIRCGLVLTAVLAIAPPAFAAPAEDVGIELPAVPAAVMGGARFVKVAATTDGSSGTDRVLELGPKTVTVEPGTTAIVEVAINHLNRIVTPFAAPQVRTVSTATTQVDGNVVYVATASEEPVALYVTDGQDPQTALSLTLAPRHLPPREIRLQPSGGPWRGGIARGTTPPAQAQPYVEGLVAAIRDLAKSKLPPGQDLRRARRGEGIRCRQPGLTVTGGQVLDGQRLAIVTGVARNSGTTALELEERSCAAGLDGSVLAIAAWPRVWLAPGEATEVFVAVRPRDPDHERRDRPSLLDPEVQR
jgi:conjugal transfer pilus assembly protein TraK